MSAASDILGQVACDEATMQSLAASMIETLSTSPADSCEPPTSTQMASRSKIVALLKSLVAGSEPSSSEDEKDATLQPRRRGRPRGSGKHNKVAAAAAAAPSPEPECESDEESDDEVDDETVEQMSKEAVAAACLSLHPEAPAPTTEEDESSSCDEEAFVVKEMLERIMKGVRQ